MKGHQSCCWPSRSNLQTEKLRVPNNRHQMDLFKLTYINPLNIHKKVLYQPRKLLEQVLSFR
jgi:hypothetical protein